MLLSSLWASRYRYNVMCMGYTQRTSVRSYPHHLIDFETLGWLKQRTISEPCWPTIILSYNVHSRLSVITRGQGSPNDAKGHGRLWKGHQRSRVTKWCQRSWKGHQRSMVTKWCQRSLGGHWKVTKGHQRSRVTNWCRWCHRSLEQRFCSWMMTNCTLGHLSVALKLIGSMLINTYNSEI